MAQIILMRKLITINEKTSIFLIPTVLLLVKIFSLIPIRNALLASIIPESATGAEELGVYPGRGSCLSVAASLPSVSLPRSRGKCRYFHLTRVSWTFLLQHL